MLRVACAGAVVAACYGALHDQASYAISSEYFTELKFRQFAWADLGWSPRVFASVVGALGSWWVGFVGGWFLARVGLDLVPAPARRGVEARAFAILLLVAATCGAIGALIGARVAAGDLSGWKRWELALELRDLRAFVIVAWLHAAGYVGAALGLALSIAYVRGRLRLR